ncbi:MAG: S8 family serine peptidase [Candidatus Sericytochromatia bacterium]|nr:S8 family serine peptidase [Candidatus Sericytochromatia bacterium]
MKRIRPLLAILVSVAPACAESPPPSAPGAMTPRATAISEGETAGPSPVLPPLVTGTSARLSEPILTGRHVVAWRDAAEVAAWKTEHTGARVLGTVTFKRTWGLVEGLAGEAARRATAERRLLPPSTLRRVSSTEPLDRFQWSFGTRYMDVEGAHAIWQARSANLGRPPVVAVIDTGSDASHPDLDVLKNLDAVESLVDENLIRTTDADPMSDHGTACAGLVGSRLDGAGGAGMAPGARILAVRVSDQNSGITDFAILQALKLSARFGQPGETAPELQGNGIGPVRVVSMSLGGYDPRVLPAYVEAIDVLKDLGIPVFVASGNEAWTDKVAAPANQPGALAIGCTMRYLDTEWLAPYSTTGPELFLTAGGNMVYAPVSQSVRGGSQRWALFNGTSSATPLAAGLAALVTWTRAAEAAALPPRVWADRLAAHLAATADDLGSPRWDPAYGYGRINARRALEAPLAEALPERL